MGSKCGLKSENSILSPQPPSHPNQTATFKHLLSKPTMPQAFCSVKKKKNASRSVHRTSQKGAGFCMLFCYLGFPLPLLLLHKMSKTSFQVNKYRTTLSFLMIAYYFSLFMSQALLNCSTIDWHVSKILLLQIRLPQTFLYLHCFLLRQLFP